MVPLLLVVIVAGTPAVVADIVSVFAELAPIVRVPVPEFVILPAAAIVVEKSHRSRLTGLKEEVE